MKFGTKVLVQRGSARNLPGTPGCLRLVKAVLIGARKNQRFVRLTQDDPLATCDYCLHAGDVGQFSPTVVTPA